MAFAVGRDGETVEECVRLTYVGVTRATHEALLTYSSETALVQRLIVRINAPAPNRLTPLATVFGVVLN